MVRKTVSVHGAVDVQLVPGTAAVRRRRQSMKPQVEVKSMNHRPTADCAPSRRRRLSHRLNAFCSIASTYFGKIFNAVVVVA